MTKSTTTLGSRLVWATICGVLVAITSLFWIDSPPRLFAQTDTTSPTVSSVAITSDTGDDDVYLDDDGVYGIGDKIEVTVTFNEDVTVTGSPQLELTVGSSAKNAAYMSTTDSKVVFSYTVAVGDSDTDGISIAADKLSPNGGSIKDAAENGADPFPRAPCRLRRDTWWMEFDRLQRARPISVLAHSVPTESTPLEKYS